MTTKLRHLCGPGRVLSGVQPTGDLHLGNYLGALVKFARLQHEIPTFIFVADLHAITAGRSRRS
jgi:tryptophanyl-tRNA synthetase